MRFLRAAYKFATCQETSDHDSCATHPDTGTAWNASLTSRMAHETIFAMWASRVAVSEGAEVGTGACWGLSRGAHETANALWKLSFSTEAPFGAKRFVWGGIDGSVEQSGGRDIRGS